MELRLGCSLFSGVLEKILHVLVFVYKISNSTGVFKLIRLHVNATDLDEKFNITSYYMPSSASGQDERNRALSLATRAGKMEPLGTTRCIPQANFLQKPYNKSFFDQVCSVKMAGYWPRSFFLRVYGPRLRLGP